MKRQSNTQPSEPEVDDDPVPKNIHEFRNELARRISRFIADRRQSWRGCPERCCRRMRACAAPHVRCSMAPPSKPDPIGRRTARVLAKVQRAFRDFAEARGEET